MGCCCGIGHVTSEENLSIDEWEIMSFDDHTWNFPMSIFEGPLSQEKRALFFHGTTVKAPTNVFIIKGNGHTILIDTGFGETLFKSLFALKINVEDVNIVLITHGHGDHALGLINDLKPRFVNASVFLSSAEKSTYVGSGNGESLLDRVATAYKSRLRTFDTNTEILPGIWTIDLSGHTAGHSGFELRGHSGMKIVFAGDFVHATDLQFANPNENSQYDEDKEKSAYSRRQIMEDAAAKKYLIAGTHIKAPGIGWVKKAKGGGYRFQPLEDNNNLGSFFTK